MLVTSMLSAGKIVVAAFRMRKGVILVHFLPRGTTVNSDCCIETLRSLNACCFMTMLGCTQMCVPEAITNFGWTIATSTQKS